MEEEEGKMMRSKEKEELEQNEKEEEEKEVKGRRGECLKYIYLILL